MTMLLAQNSGFTLPWTNIFLAIFIVVSVVMILIVLIQRPQVGGLSGAFGASSEGAGQTAFGAKTGDVLTLATVTVFVLFLLFAIGLNFAMRPDTVDDTTNAGAVEEGATSDVLPIEPGAELTEEPEAEQDAGTAAPELNTEEDPAEG